MRQLRNLSDLLTALPEMVVTATPGRGGNGLRTRYYRKRLKSLGKNVTIDVGAQLVNPEHISIGDGTWIDKYAVILAGPPSEGSRKISRTPNPLFEHAEGDVVIGKRCHIAHHVVINGHGGVQIGDSSGVAAGARIVSLSHHYMNPADEDDTFAYRFTPRAHEGQQSLLSSPVVMGANTALATNSLMLPGSSIGENSWVGALSLVSSEIPAGCIAVGVPAKKVKERKLRIPRVKP